MLEFLKKSDHPDVRNAVSAVENTYFYARGGRETLKAWAASPTGKAYHDSGGTPEFSGPAAKDFVSKGYVVDN